MRDMFVTFHTFKMKLLNIFLFIIKLTNVRGIFHFNYVRIFLISQVQQTLLKQYICRNLKGFILYCLIKIQSKQSVCLIIVLVELKPHDMGFCFLEINNKFKYISNNLISLNVFQKHAFEYERVSVYEQNKLIVCNNCLSYRSTIFLYKENGNSIKVFFSLNKIIFFIWFLKQYEPFLKRIQYPSFAEK